MHTPANQGITISRIVLMLVCVVLGFVPGLGCHSPTGGPTPAAQAILGEWEMTNLKKIEHVSHFAKAVLIFQPDGMTRSYLVSHKGEKVQETLEPYRIRGDTLHMGAPDDDNDYRFVIKGTNLSMKVIKAVAEDSIGLTMKLHRRE